MQFTLGALAQLLQAPLIGDPEIVVDTIAHPKQAQHTNQLVLVFDSSLVPMLPQLAIKSAIVPEGANCESIPNRIVVKRPKVALAQLLSQVAEPPYILPDAIHSTAVVDPSATIAASATIGPNCWIGPNVAIGENTHLMANISVGQHATIGSDNLFYPGVYIGDRVIVGNRVIIHANSVLGSDGFSFVTEEPGILESGRQTLTVQATNSKSLKIPSVGNVIIEDDVEIGACCTVDRATLSDTRIKRGSKLDNQIQIAHNVIIGEDGIIAAQAGIAGSAVVGDRCIIGGQAGIGDHLTIGDDSVIVSTSAVIHDIPNKTVAMGIPAVTAREFMKKERDSKRIDKLVEDTKALQARLTELEAELNTPARV